jgi:hypothetical protein
LRPLFQMALLGSMAEYLGSPFDRGAVLDIMSI